MLGFYTVDMDSNQPTLQYSVVRWVIYGLAILHLVMSLIWLGMFAWDWGPIIIYKGEKKAQEKLRQINKARIKEGKEPLTSRHTIFHKIGYLLSDNWLIYRFVYIAFSVLGIWAPSYFCFHLLDLSIQNAQIRNVLKAVTTNGRSILLTGLLVLMIVYCYAMLAFFQFRDFVTDPLYCNSLWGCLATTFFIGVRSGGGIGDILMHIPFEPESGFWPRFFFDFSFYIIIIVILLNVVFGIILDTFGQLRDERDAFETDIKTKCFICGVQANTFQQKALGFEYHIKREHNMWNYLFFFVHLDEKNKDEYTFAEEYVSSKKAKLDASFFPTGTAISILGQEEKEDGEE